MVDDGLRNCWCEVSPSSLQSHSGDARIFFIPGQSQGMLNLTRASNEAPSTDQGAKGAKGSEALGKGCPRLQPTRVSGGAS